MEQVESAVSPVFAGPHSGHDSVRGRLRPISHQPLRHAVLAEIRRRITEGVYEQGARLFEDQIAAELEVSRNPVREALQALAAEGFVELEPRRGARVARVPAERAAELFEVRAALEGLMARLAAERRTEADVDLLRSLVDRGLAAVASADRSSLPMLNTEFHAALGDAARNGLLVETIQQLSHVIQWVYARHVGQRGAASWAEHAAIVEAVAARDVEAAHRAAAAHIEGARRVYMDAAG
jgi:DNA-binding GntR family transcriptional regulator